MRARIVAILLAGTTLFACSGTGKKAGVPLPPDAATVSTNGGGYRVTYAPKPDPIPMNEEFQLLVHVETAEGETVSADVQLVADAAMPQHHHGMNRVPTVRSVGGGSFIVDGMLFHMPGSWELYFDVTEGAWTERAQVDVELE